MGCILPPGCWADIPEKQLQKLQGGVPAQPSMSMSALQDPGALLDSHALVSIPAPCQHRLSSCPPAFPALLSMGRKPS